MSWFPKQLIGGLVGGQSSAPILGAGSSTAPLTTATADTKFMDFRLKNTATSGDNRGMYLRLALAGAGGGGEAARIFTVVDDVAAGTAHGAHISLGFDTEGSVTGLGAAVRGTLHIPNDADWAPGTVTALQAEIYSDGAASDTDGATDVSFIRVVNDGNASGVADVDDDAALFSLSGFTIGAGNMVQADDDETKFSHKIRIKIAGTVYYLMATAT